MKMKFEGGRELAGKLLKLPDQVSKKFMTKAMKKSAQPILARAIAKAPIKSGELVAGLHIEGSNRSGETTVIVADSKEAYYGRMQEHGTRKMKPHPFLVQALEDYVHEVIVDIAEDLAESIEGAMEL